MASNIETEDADLFLSLAKRESPLKGSITKPTLSRRSLGIMTGLQSQRKGLDESSIESWRTVRSGCPSETPSSFVDRSSSRASPRDGLYSADYTGRLPPLNSTFHPTSASASDSDSRLRERARTMEYLERRASASSDLPTPRKQQFPDIDETPRKFTPSSPKKSDRRRLQEGSGNITRHEVIAVYEERPSSRFERPTSRYTNQSRINNYYPQDDDSSRSLRHYDKTNPPSRPASCSPYENRPTSRHHFSENRPSSRHPCYPEYETSDTRLGVPRSQTEPNLARQSRSQDGSSNASTTYTVWDELEDLKTRIKRLEIDQQRPTTATTSSSGSPNTHPLLHAALIKAKMVLSTESYRALEAVSSEAIQLAKEGGPSKKRGDTICRGLTELSLSLSERPPTRISLPEPSRSRSIREEFAPSIDDRRLSSRSGSPLLRTFPSTPGGRHGRAGSDRILGNVLDRIGGRDRIRRSIERW
ncbi:hypothetical protein NEOLI_004261 [Neolecta irregularis DAH-3]|uniref:Uncharacterized protein n=1 Tax=Neolecta irregularis (strain DAH-3) TaxID=1198029 RepID=A0A1U7LH00_NEOID|nr:hypothetical protein NEOLI_004261 [Neolecta irregularis DAH-3]|eukprot:OLL21873.1 hypothetical protein NEOLI_004261 [Neolecta irregularis DAH-3]